VEAEEQVTWKEKLHPGRFSHMSPRMAAVVGYVTSRPYTTPEIKSICVTSDGHVIANGEYFGVLKDLRENWGALLDSAGLTPGERCEAVEAYDLRVVDQYKDTATRASVPWG